MVETILPDGILPSPPSQLSAEPWETLPKSSTAQSQQNPAESTSAARLQDNSEHIAPLIRFTSGQSPSRQFKILQQWEGIVTDVYTDSVMADLLDLTDTSKPREFVEIPLAEIPDAD